MIASEVEAQMEKAGNFGAEFERVARIGAVARICGWCRRRVRRWDRSSCSAAARR